MKNTNERLTFLTPTHFNLPITIYNTLIEDALYFNILKNNQASISGLLNHLIPNMAEYRNDLHLSFLKENDYNVELTNKIEKNIYKTYFNQYDYCDDGTTSVSFRVNSRHEQQFLDIYDNVLYRYNMNFTEFVRSVLIEYSSKRLNQREYFFYYNEIHKIKEAIQNSKQCVFYLEKEKISFVPVSVEISRKGEHNLIIGYDFENDMAHIVPILLLKRIVLNDIKYEVRKEEINFVYECFEEYENRLMEQE